MVVRKKIYRYLILAVVFILIFLTILLALKEILPGFVEVLEKGDRADIEAYIRGFGTFKGVLIGILLQFMQLISIVFPGGPIQISMGIIFGTWLGFGICFVGYVAASCAAFSAMRAFGDKLRDWMPIEEEEKSEKMSFIRRIKSPELMVMITSMTPFIPNGLVPYLAARTKLSFRAFLFSVSAGCAPGLLLLCAAGNQILKGKYLEAGIYGAVLVAFVLFLTVKQKLVLAFAEKVKSKFKKGGKPGKPI
ncbi:MAG TPA: VTT domain-containing protein [Oscillospiraceae bacterium]|nr:VTT domain-containing protein [Oscillospiraceae bacterium]HPS34838.1 VTT domain-containing protein [Oscillospiraceae bacterium]